ncbi:TPA: hypothetical protein ACH3X3_006448 [Trebouxia sp. C0006]
MLFEALQSSFRQLPSHLQHNSLHAHINFALVEIYSFDQLVRYSRQQSLTSRKAWHRSLRLTMVNKEDSSMSLAGLVIGKTCITWRVAESNITWFCKILSSAPALL